MRRLTNYFKIVFLLLIICSSSSIAAQNFSVNLSNNLRVVTPKHPVDGAPAMYIRKGDNYVTHGKITRVRIDARDYFVRKKIKVPTEIKLKITKPNVENDTSIWVRTSTLKVNSMKKASNLNFALDLGSFLTHQNEEFTFSLYNEHGTLIQEYSQIFTAEDFNPGFAIKQDSEFAACAIANPLIECVYEAFGNIMIKQTPSKSESFIARNRDGSLVLSIPTIKRAKKAKKKKSKKSGASPAVINTGSDGDTKSVNTRSTITSGSDHYHGFTEHLGRFSMIATSWDSGHPYTNPAAYGNYSAVFGRNNKTSNASIIAGEDNFTTSYSAVFGRTNTGMSSYSLIAGQDNVVDSSYALVSGKNNEVQNSAGSLVVGYYNDVNGQYASAVGHANRVNGIGSHVIGSGVQVNGDYSFAFGFGNTTAPTKIFGDKKIAFVYGTETLLMVDGVNGDVQIGGGNGGTMSGFFNGTFVGDGSGLYNLNPNSFNGVIMPPKGGTGIANVGTFSWGNSNINITNDFDLTLRLQGATDLTLPTSGVLVTRNGSEMLINKTINNSTLGPNLSFDANTMFKNGATFLDTMFFNGTAVFNSDIRVPNCNPGDFLLATANGTLQCTDFYGSVSNGSASFNPLGDNGSIQYRLNGVVAGSNAARVVNGGNGLEAQRIDTEDLGFTGPSSQVTGTASFVGQFDYTNSVILNDSFRIPTCTTPNYILANNGSGHFTCVDPNTIISGGGNGGSAVGANFAIQFNNNGSFASDPGFRFENGSLIVDNINGVQVINFSAATIGGAANFTGDISMTGSLSLVDGNEGNGKILVGDSNGRLSWAFPSDVFSGTGNGSGGNGLTAAAGVNGSIQFNQGGNLAADHNRLQYTEDTLKAQAITAVSLTTKNPSAALAIDWSEGNQQQINLSQDSTTISVAQDPAGPTTVMMQLIHNANVGVKTIIWPANFTFSDGSPPILSTQANAVDFVSCFYNPNVAGGTYYCQASYNFF